MHLLRPAFLERFPDRVVNVHPALLPAFPGAHAVEDALAAGVGQTGATVHLVDEGIDTGRVLRQEAVPVLPGDTVETLHARIQDGRASPAARRSSASWSPHDARAALRRTTRPVSVAFADGLAALDVEILASGGTAATLEEAGIRVTRIETLTGFDSLLGHRVVTLHPAIHAGILARRDVEDDLDELEDHDLAPIDIVCVNLYPFEKVVGGVGVTLEEAVEMIDVGGPAMLRAAAKNHAHVTAICRPDDYDVVLDELRTGGAVSEVTRRLLAVRAFRTTAAYDAAIATHLDVDALPEIATLDVRPRRRAVVRREPAPASRVLLATGRAHPPARPGRPAAAASRCRSTTSTTSRPPALLSLELDDPACVIVKHANPCGVGVADSIESGLSAGARRAIPSRRTAASSSSTGRSAPRSASCSRSSSSRSCSRPDTTSRRSRRSSASRRPGSSNDLERRSVVPDELDVKRVLGGLLVQERDLGPDPLDAMDVVCGEVERATLGRPAVRLDGRQARLLERDRDRARRPDPRDRRRTDEPRRRRPPRGRQGRASTATRSRAPCSRPTRSSRSPTVSSSRSTQA